MALGLAIPQVDGSRLFLFILHSVMMSPFMYIGSLYFLFIIVNIHCLGHSLSHGLLCEKHGGGCLVVSPFGTSSDTSSTQGLLLVAFLVRLQADEEQEFLWQNKREREGERLGGWTNLD